MRQYLIRHPSGLAVVSVMAALDVTYRLWLRGPLRAWSGS
jgi:hypothetical protein